MEIFRKVSAVEGLECTADGKFRYNGKPKKVICPNLNFANGRKATARITYRVKGKSYYIQASKAVAMAWKSGYNPDKDYILYRDGDIHNISADNLVIGSADQYTAFRQRRSGYEADSASERIRKLEQVIKEASMTKHYLETKDLSPVHRHVKERLYVCLMNYCKETLHLGEKTALDIVPECIARMYQVIMNGMCLYNYERYCKKLLLNYKKKRNFGFTGLVPKPIEIEVTKLNLDCLWERYQKSTRK